jgi:hypothetical protein
MIIYRLYKRKDDAINYIKYIHIKCVSGKFYTAKPGKKYISTPTYLNWPQVHTMLSPNFNLITTKTFKQKPLSEVEWLDKVCENFKEPELDNDF